MNAEESERCAVLSPHPDDAVLSAFHVLASQNVVDVIVVFAGIPDRGFVTPLDRSHGATESAAWVRRRLEEDADIMGALARGCTHLNFLDAQYRAHHFPELRAALEADPGSLIPIINSYPDARADVDSIFEAVAVSVASDVVVYAPVGIGGHPDHVAVGRVALKLHQHGWRVRFYADAPYYMRAGLPTWLTRTPNPEADAAVEEGIAAVFPEHMPRRRALAVLSPDIVKCKIAAAKRYYTEFAFIDVDFGGISSDPAMMRYEPYWFVGSESGT